MTSLLVGTTKGAFILHAGPGRRRWKLDGPHHFGSVVNDVRLDPRDGRTLISSVGGGHLGPTVFISSDRGRSWKESARPPRFEKGKARPPGKQTSTAGLAVSSCFWLEPGHASEPGCWYLGTTPAGLFRSTDGGRSWRGVPGLNSSPIWARWNDHGRNATPGGSILHSIQIDPRDKRRMYVSISGGGTCETTDQGKSWTPLSQGLENDLVPGEPGDFGHDPHCMIIHPADPDRLYQQSHFGIYALDRRGEQAPGRRAGRNAADRARGAQARRDAPREPEAGEPPRWTRIGRRMPKAIGDIGFPMVGHPTDPETVWVFPMDGTKVWPRTSPGGKPAVYRTHDGGRSWQRGDAGLPREHAFYTVKRQAMCADRDGRAPGVSFGTTCGDVWTSRDGGESWTRIAEGLPHIYSVRVAEFL